MHRYLAKNLSKEFSGSILRFVCATAFFALMLFQNSQYASAVPASKPQAGKPVPTFEITDINGNSISSESLKGKVVVLEWFNPGCPYVQRIYKDDKTQKLQREAKEKDVVWVLVNSTAESHKDYLDKEKTEKLLGEWNTAQSHYVIDADGKLGKLFSAATTPTYFIFSKEGDIRYMGAVDNYPEGDDEPGKMKYYFEEALQSVLDGRAVTVAETKSYGCSVKYAN